VQTAVYADYGNVLIAAEKLQKQFKQPIIVNINELAGKTVYKVLVGAFANSADASSLQKTMKAGGVDGFVKDLKGMA
jgi:cell division septation protein DedD